MRAFLVCYTVKALYYGQPPIMDNNKIPDLYVTFFNSVIKTSLLLWTLLMDSRLLQTLFLVPIEEKVFIGIFAIIIIIQFI